MMAAAQSRIAVVGAGVVGLSTAVQCQQKWPNSVVTIVADELEDTTSAGAGGIIRPTAAKTPGVPIERLKQWLRDSWVHYDRLAHSEEGWSTGIQIISGYQFYNNVKENPLEKELVYHYRALTTKEMTMFPGTQDASHGFFVTTLMAEGKFYCDYLRKMFLRLGGRMRRQHITDLSELADESDVVFNCTGIGSRELMRDSKVVPIRGQLIKVKAPWIKHTLLYGDKAECFIYPGRDSVTVGCTRQVGDFDLNPRDEDTSRILKDVYRLVPSLKNAPVTSVWVGLRPHREPLRVQHEVISTRGKRLHVVHNYGHGAEGINLSWGTSKEAVQIAEQILREDDATGARNSQNTPKSKI